MEAEYFADLALQWGADHAVPFRIDDIVFDPRTILKCAFGCGDWGYGNTCPSRPLSLKPWEYEQVLPGGLSSIRQTNGFRRTFRSELSARPFCAAIIWPFRSVTAPYAGSAPDLRANHASIPRRRVRPFTVWASMFSRQCTSSACRSTLSRVERRLLIGTQPCSLSDGP